MDSDRSRKSRQARFEQSQIGVLLSVDDRWLDSMINPSKMSATMTEMRPDRNPRDKPLSSGMAVSFFAAIACVATLVTVMVTGITSPNEQISSDNPFAKLVTGGIGFVQYVEFAFGGAITLTLALVGFFLSISASGSDETTGNLAGVLLSVASVVALILFLIFFMLL